MKTPEVRRIVHGWRSDHGLGGLPKPEQLALCAALIRGHVERRVPSRRSRRRPPTAAAFAEEKFAGTLYIQRYLLRRVPPEPILDLAEDLFTGGAFYDWSTTDWFCVRVLGPLITRHGGPAARRIAAWRDAADLWQRRAAIVPFRAVAADETYHPMIRSTIATLAPDPERFIQTGIGWVISDLAKSHPDEAAALVERHFDDLSSEVIRRHTKRLPRHHRYRARKTRRARDRARL